MCIIVKMLKIKDKKKKKQEKKLIPQEDITSVDTYILKKCKLTELKRKYKHIKNNSTQLGTLISQF